MKPSSLTLALAAAISFASLTACSQNAQEEQAAQQEMPPPVVNIMPVQFQSVPQFKTFSGRTVAYESSEVRPQASGIIEEILFKEGSVVQKGQPLYRINPDNYTNALASGASAIEQAQANLDTANANKTSAQATLESQQATLEQAQQTYNRYVTLQKQGAVSEQLVEQANADLKKAKAGVATAEAAINQAEAAIKTASANINSAQASMATNELNASRTIITAPIAGVTGSSNFTVGTLVSANQANALVTITKTNPMYVDISQSSSEWLKLRREVSSGKLKTGTNAVQLILEDGSTYNQNGQLQFNEYKVDETTGAVTLRAVFPNNGLLMPGMFVTAKMAQAVIANAVLLPQSAIMRTPKGETQVYIVDADNVVQARDVTVNGTYNGMWVVTSGLQQGENVVAVGGSQMMMQVKPGVKVQTKPMPTEEELAKQEMAAQVAKTGKAPANQAVAQSSQTQANQTKANQAQVAKSSDDKASKQANSTTSDKQTSKTGAQPTQPAQPKAEERSQQQTAPAQATPKTPQQAADEQAQKEAAAMADEVSN